MHERIGGADHSRDLHDEIHAHIAKREPNLPESSWLRTYPSGPYQKRLTAYLASDIFGVLVRKPEATTAALLIPRNEFDTASLHQLITEIITFMRKEFTHFDAALNLYLRFQVILQSYAETKEIWAGDHGIARALLQLFQSIRTTNEKEDQNPLEQLHIFFVEYILQVYELLNVFRSLNNRLGENNRDLLLAGLLHASLGQLSIIMNGFFYSSRDHSEKAYRSFVSGTLNTIDILHRISLYCSGDIAFSGNLNEITNLVAHDKLKIEVDHLPTLDPNLSQKHKLEIFLLVQEILHNAIKYSTQTKTLSEERSIKVESNLDEEFWEFTVSNQGRTVDLKTQAALFLPHVRVKEPHEVIGGTGFGLSMVKAICEELGGSVAFVAPTDGYRSALKIKLPKRLFAANPAA
jgi:signal transduction histidine kinase